MLHPSGGSICSLVRMLITKTLTEKLKLMEILGLIFLWFETHAVAKASDLPLLMKYLENLFHSLLLPCSTE